MADLWRTFFRTNWKTGKPRTQLRVETDRFTNSIEGGTLTVEETAEALDLVPAQARYYLEHVHIPVAYEI